MSSARTVSTWTGGASAFRQWSYRLVEEAGRYELQVVNAAGQWEAVLWGHLKAQGIASHIAMEDRERIARRRIRA